MSPCCFGIYWRASSADISSRITCTRELYETPRERFTKSDLFTLVSFAEEEKTTVTIHSHVSRSFCGVPARFSRKSFIEIQVPHHFFDRDFSHCCFQTLRFCARRCKRASEMSRCRDVWAERPLFGCILLARSQLKQWSLFTYLQIDL